MESKLEAWFQVGMGDVLGDSVTRMGCGKHRKDRGGDRGGG